MHKMRIDEHMPTFDVSESEHIVIDASPSEVFEAIRTAPIARDPVIGALAGIRRGLTAAASTLGISDRRPASAFSTLDDLVEDGVIAVLDEQADEEIVLGAIVDLGAVLARAIPLVREAFEGFDAPGHVRIAVGISIQSYAGERSLVSIEHRFKATDPSARRTLERLDRIAGRLGHMVAKRELEGIKRRAEGPARERLPEIRTTEIHDEL